MTSRRAARDKRRDDSKTSDTLAALEQELHARQTPNRFDRRSAERTAARGEAEGFARVTGKHYRGGISA